MLVLLERQAESQLTGCQSFPSPGSSIENVPAENCISERSMALLDNVLNLKPSAAVATIESIKKYSDREEGVKEEKT